ncbi:ATP-binding protein [Actinomadura xylanilytica]|uniref:ATP-binding protein n=1 Tax=Actinomadura xylanilytica TaxID=887459 RepID=UPI00255A812F|nr:BTAD domain-containing putative transcriptional regulator [Actinomadura xylanilytica]MDL4773863.1 BTAD domain-containing putative transcriptional regulator [Actinomadura xylanilytica]
MRFGVLGETRAWRADGSEVPLGGPARRALLALLLTRPGAPVSVDRLIDGGAGGGRALQSQMSRLRAALRPEAEIELTPAGYRLGVQPDDVDAWRFERQAGEGRDALRGGDPERAAGLLRAALGWWRGDAFADVADGPARASAERLEERRLEALEDRIDAELRTGGRLAVVPELRELVERHPLRERPRALLMRALRDEGRPAEALVAFEDARRTLADELGADPSAELGALHRELLAAPPRGPAAPPAQLTSFVGRDAETAELGALLGTVRLVTLLGPGGVGKTRMAVEVASGEGCGEVCFVELAPVRDGAALPQALLVALGLREGGPLSAPAGPVPPLSRLVAALADRPLLLVLDNCEHLVDAVAELAHALLSACPGLRVLATSREPLGITGEHLWSVRPLEGDAAVRLFADRASAVRRGFALDRDRATVRRICAALDDLPLAIELAAARLRTQDLAELAAGLDDRFGLLERGARTADARHRTLRAMVAWSWDLLTDDEQRAARRFTVFAGGADAASAQAVCGVPNVRDALESLADKSLLEVTAGRYRMLETIRAYGAERLNAAGEDDLARRAHAARFLDLARTAGPYLHGDEQLRWLPVLAADHDNLLAALRRTVEAGATGTAFRLLGSMAAYLWIRGLSAAAAGAAAALLDLVGPGAPSGLEEEYVVCALVAAADPATARAWSRHRRAAGAAIAAIAAGAGRHPFVPFRWLMAAAEPDEAETAFALITADLGSAEPWARAAAHLISGYPELAAGDAVRAEQEFTAALAAFRSTGDRWGTALALDSLAGLAALCGDPGRAITLTDEALVLSERLGAVDDQSDLLCNRGDYRFGADPEGARADYARAAALARRAGRPTYLAAALRGLGDLALHDGDPGGARRLYEDALDRFDPNWIKSVGNRTRALVGLGRVAEAGGDRAGARVLYRRAIEVAAARGALFEAARGVVALAGSALADGDPAPAATLLGAARALRGIAGDADADAPRIEAAARAELGEGPYRDAHRTGLRMGPAQVLRLTGLPESVAGERAVRVR